MTMKFVCLKCETYMTFEKVEKPAEGSLGVFFSCPSCQASFSMVTNPGETQMVSSLGVQLGGRAAPASPLEMTRQTLREEVGTGTKEMAAYLNEKILAGQSATAEADSTQKAEQSASGCPFSAMVAQMGLTSGGQSTSSAEQATPLTWTPEAKERLERLPSFVQPIVRSSVEAFARKQGYTTVTLQVMDDSKQASSGVTWTREAEQRLENIPDFIRPMARREIERLAKERGTDTVTVQVMDEAKEKFMKFM
ncbi:MAG: hypothetical protein D6704_01975 [Nitrospirae bacterium]|nr:MAG: hypothetical protein D6704_01975 [Nitrospirota bacterium]